MTKYDKELDTSREDYEEAMKPAAKEQPERKESGESDAAAEGGDGDQ